jgi:hypothetical protein
MNSGTARSPGRTAPSALVYALIVASVASAVVTLLAPHLLSGPAVMNGSAKGTAVVVALGGCPTLLLAHRRARSGSLPALTLAAGAAVYLVYNAVLLVFATPINRAFLLYEAMLGLAIWTLIALVAELRARAGRPARPPSRWAAGFVGGVVLLNAAAWGSRVVPALLSDRTGSMLAGTGLTTNPVYVQDLAFWLPAIAWIAIGMWKEEGPRTALGAAALCYWLLESVSIAVDQWWGHHDDPTSSVASGAAVPLFLVVAAVTLWPLAHVLRSVATAAPRRVGAVPRSPVPDRAGRG